MAKKGEKGKKKVGARREIEENEQERDISLL